MAAPAIASVLSSIYNSYLNKQANNRLVEERIRHNKALESGTGLYMNRKPRALQGDGIRLKPIKNAKKRRKPQGNGLLEELLKKKKLLR